MHSRWLLDFDEWVLMMKELNVMDEDFAAREVAVTFVWSRMRCIDLSTIDSQVRNTQMAFTDFMEAVCHIATIKRLPTDDQIFEHGYEDAGEFLVMLRKESPADYKDFMAETVREWDESLPQPIFRLVDHTCSLLARSFASVRRQRKASAGRGSTDRKET